VAVGDKVLIKDSLVAVEDNPNYLNCTVKLEQAMPPSGAETQLKLNTVQLEKAGPPKAQPLEAAPGAVKAAAKPEPKAPESKK